MRTKYFVLGLLTFGIFSFKAIQEYQAKKSTAEVDMIQGLYIFTGSKPVSEFEYLGTVKSNGRFGGSGQYEPVRDNLARIVKKDFPNANGVVMHLVNGSTDRADAILIK